MPVAAWHIYHVSRCVHLDPIKPKFVIIVCITDVLQPMGFLINTRVPAFIRNQERLQPCTVPILKSLHPRLKYDSHLTINKLYPFDTWELKHKRGKVNDTTKQNILAAVYECPILKRGDKKLILGE